MPSARWSVKVQKVAAFKEFMAQPKESASAVHKGKSWPSKALRERVRSRERDAKEWCKFDLVPEGWENCCLLGEGLRHGQEREEEASALGLVRGEEAVGKSRKTLRVRRSKSSLKHCFQFRLPHNLKRNLATLKVSREEWPGTYKVQKPCRRNRDHRRQAECFRQNR